MTFATAADVKALAEKQPESGFNAATGELRIGGVTYKARKFTNARRKEIRRLDEERDNASHAAASMTIAGKFDIVDGDPVLKPGQAPPTAEEMIAVQAASDELQDTLFYKLPVLYQSDDGSNPTVEAAMEELTDAEAAQAVEFAQANPTARKTGTTSG